MTSNTCIIFYDTEIAVACPPLVPPANGAVTQSGLLAGDIATYTCNAAYELMGNDTRVCDSNGIWTNSVPVCTRKYMYLADLLYIF